MLWVGQFEPEADVSHLSNIALDMNIENIALIPAITRINAKSFCFMIYCLQPELAKKITSSLIMKDDFLILNVIIWPPPESKYQLFFLVGSMCEH
jgi:hypothetical protein